MCRLVSCRSLFGQTLQPSPDSEWFVFVSTREGDSPHSVLNVRVFLGRLRESEAKEASLKALLAGRQNRMLAFPREFSSNAAEVHALDLAVKNRALGAAHACFCA